MTAPQEQHLDVAGGDVALSRHVKDSLRLLARRSDDREFTRIVDDVLAGRRSLREAHTDPAYTRVMDTQVQAFATRWDALSEEEKAELARIGEAQLAELGAQPPRPEDLPPVDGPDPDDDDDDFGDGPVLRPVF